MSTDTLLASARNIPQKESMPRLFVRWYFIVHPLVIVQAYGAYFRALLAVFSFGFILKTLFSPWKGIIDAYPHKGFNVEAILSTFFLNLTTRMIGAAFRFFTLCAGVLVLTCVSAGFAAYLFFWYMLPFLILTSPYLLFRII